MAGPLTPLENFDHQLLLALALATAHNSRCLHKAGLLDDDARKSLQAHFKNLSETATEIGDPDHLAWVDLLQRTLPPPLP